MRKEVFIEPDEFTNQISVAFDYEFNGLSHFNSFEIPQVPEDYNIGVIVGASGTGKSTLLQDMAGEQDYIGWMKDKAIISHFGTPDNGVNMLSAVGLNSVPSWCKPYHVLSTGEKFRADLARRLHSDSYIDEFTSVVDRTVAKATSYAVQKFIRNNDLKRMVFATCHEDILEWLEPDWIFNTNNGQLLVGRSLRRPSITIDIYPSKHSVWDMFKNHHYLSEKLNKATRCYVAVYDGKIIGFNASISQPSGTMQNAWREHRTVILPDYQGMGIGTRFSDAIAQLFKDDGKRYFSKTAHIRMGEYRQHSPLWKPTSKNKLWRADKEQHQMTGWKINGDRVCYSHEYIGK